MTKPWRSATSLLSVERERVQIVSREVGSEIRSVSPDRAVFHQAVAEKDLLAERDIGVREQYRSVRAHDSLGIGGASE